MWKKTGLWNSQIIKQVEKISSPTDICNIGKPQMKITGEDWDWSTNNKGHDPLAPLRTVNVQKLAAEPTEKDWIHPQLSTVKKRDASFETEEWLSYISEKLGRKPHFVRDNRRGAYSVSEQDRRGHFTKRDEIC